MVAEGVGSVDAPAEQAAARAPGPAGEPAGPPAAPRSRFGRRFGRRLGRRPGRRPGRVRERLPAGLLFSLCVYLASRVPVVVTTAVFLARTPNRSVAWWIDSRDGWWYTRIAEDGYATSLLQPVTDPGDPHHGYSPWGFFPGYPLLIRGVHELTRLPYPAAAVVVAAICGFLAVWAVYGLGAAHGGVRVGQGAALLVAAFPGSVAFTWPYSDGAFVAAAAAALTALHRRRWALAGVLAAATTLVRPTGVAVVVAAGAVAVVELVRRRDPRPLVAPAVGALGGVAFVALGWARTGDVQVWRHAENLWHQQLDFGRDLVTTVKPLIRHPERAWRTHAGQVNLVMGYVDLVALALLAVLLLAGVVAWRRLTVATAVYVAVATFTMLAYSAVGPRPRMVLAVVPGFVWLAARLPRWATVTLAALFVPLLVAVTWAWLWGVTP